MILKNISFFFFQFFTKIINQFREIYLNSNFYDKKISKIIFRNIVYKPSPHLLSSLIKYQKKKFNVNDYLTENLWEYENFKSKDFKRLNNFYWFFSIDLKSSKKTIQLIVSNWIKNNFRYNDKSWEFDITAKRIIAWLSNHYLTYDGSDEEYKNQFNWMIQKQTNHLISEINKSHLIHDKIIGCAAIILVALCYNDEKKFLSFGLNTLRKISNSSLDSNGFPKTRSIKQLILYLKYFILIREWFKESKILIPEHINETIYHLGQGYAFTWQNIKHDILFNGNNISNNIEFDHYLKRFGYKFKNETKEFGGYVILQNKKISLIMDIGPSPSSKFSRNYQSGALSFEIISNGKKLISNCGNYNFKNSQLNLLSKSTATHSTLILDDQSSCKFKKFNKKNYILNDGLRILKKDIIFEKNFWKINASHNGYIKRYDSIHEREIEFYPEHSKFIGSDKIIFKKSNLNIKFDIRFHLEPDIKLMKTQDSKTILIELNEEGWKFECKNFNINIDNGLYFGNKNSYKQNQNIFISGITNNLIENIKWELIKI